jgi:hypothetical protein
LSPAALRLALKAIAWGRNSATNADRKARTVEWRLPRPISGAAATLPSQSARDARTQVS